MKKVLFLLITVMAVSCGKVGEVEKTVMVVGNGFEFPMSITIEGNQTTAFIINEARKSLVSNGFKKEEVNQLKFNVK